jgi:hypothetical protein
MTQSPTEAYKWAGIGYELGFFLFFGCVCAIALKYKRYVLSRGTKRSGSGEDDDADLDIPTEDTKEEEEKKKSQAVVINVLSTGSDVSNSNNSSGDNTKNKPNVASALPFEPMVLSFRDIVYTVPIEGGQQRVLLDKVSGYAKPGTLTALMVCLLVLSARPHFFRVAFRLSFVPALSFLLLLNSAGLLGRWQNHPH